MHVAMPPPSVCLFLSLCVSLLLAPLSPVHAFVGTPQCTELRPEQLQCSYPGVVDPTSNKVSSCTPQGTYEVTCTVRAGVTCTGSRTLTQSRPCLYTSDVSWYVATGLSAFPFLGMLGLDRMYMGYPALGLLKFVTGGGFFAWAWLDLILISSQAIGPADGYSWEVGFAGQRFYTVHGDPIPYLEQPLSQ